MKPSIYEFDEDSNTELALDTCPPHSFYWENETLLDGKEKCKKKNNDQRRKTKAGVPVEEVAAEEPAAGDTPFDEPPAMLSAESGSEHDEGFNHDQARLSMSGLVKDQKVDDDPTCRITEKTLGECPGIVPGRVRLRMLVSWKHLKLASPVFRKMFAGPYVEGVTDDRGLRRVSATDWDPEAFVIVLDIIHGHHRSVPKSLSLEMLAKVAVIVDYYGCHEIIDVFVDIWLKEMEKCPPTIYGKDSLLWLLVSWVFSRADTFQSSAGLALKHSERSIMVENLPIPAIILDRIDSERQDALSQVFSAVYGLLDSLCDQSDCSYECSSMLLGSLTKELSKRGILNPRITGPFTGYSIATAKSMIHNFRSPQWCSSSSSGSYYGCNQHYCNLMEKMAPTLEEIEKKLPVLKLKDFQGRQTVKRGRRKGKGRGSQRRARYEVDEVKEVIHVITEAEDKIMALNSTQSVVIALFNLLPESTYHVFVDNLFSSPDFFRSFRQHGHGATGTARPNCGIYKGLADAKKADKAGKSGFKFNKIKVIPTADNQVGRLDILPYNSADNVSSSLGQSDRLEG
ncbi:hypothetical protein MRS44_013417 [Fusarium solani]|uniref:uncharacterized protein n=1 Tax=Fusarium solani TaxID=169388 RepID=UPI0032C407F5|nr:hypothetical protein MRS44_013417 [Fusarium solani]